MEGLKHSELPFLSGRMVMALIALAPTKVM